MRFLINAQAWLLIITTVAGVMIAIIGSVVVMRLILRDVKKELVDWILFAVLLIACITLVLTIVIVASAAENSTPPAPAENAITVKGYASCPTEFNPDDLGWAMHEEKRTHQKIDEHLLVVEHKRIFSYFPDPEQRIFVGLKQWKNPDCVAEIFSYGSAHGVQKRVLAMIRSSEKTAVFLLTEKGWEAGDDWETFADYSAEPHNLVFALYREKVQVASRALPIEPATAQRYFHFQEPVE